MAIGEELLNVPMGDMIRQMAFAIAEGQLQLDSNSIEVAEMMGGLQLVTNDNGQQSFDDSRIFFGYEMMTITQAKAYVAADDAFTGGDKAALTALVDDQAGKLQGDNKDKPLIRVPTRMSMLELGFTPTFYQFVDTIIEVKIAIKITRETTRTTNSKDTSTRTSTFSKGGGVMGALFGGKKRNATAVSTCQVDASYSSKYSYSAEGASLLRTKLVPLPPPPILEERIRRQMDADDARRAALNPPKPAPVV